MAQTRRKPPMVSSPAQLKLWRAEAAGATQAVLAEVLGISTRAIASWEGGACPLPPMLGWALVGAQKHVASLSLYHQRKEHQARRRRERAKRDRIARAKASAKRAVVREFARERQAEVEAQRKALRVDLRNLERASRKFIAEAERNGPIVLPDPVPVSFLAPPRAEVVRPRAIRSDVGGSHKWRGRPGLALRPEDLHDEA